MPAYCLRSLLAPISTAILSSGPAVLCVPDTIQCGAAACKERKSQNKYYSPPHTHKTKPSVLYRMKVTFNFHGQIHFDTHTLSFFSLSLIAHSDLQIQWVLSCGKRNLKSPKADWRGQPIDLPHLLAPRDTLTSLTSKQARPLSDWLRNERKVKQGMLLWPFEHHCWGGALHTPLPPVYYRNRFSLHRHLTLEIKSHNIRKAMTAK